MCYIYALCTLLLQVWQTNFTSFPARRKFSPFLFGRFQWSSCETSSRICELVDWQQYGDSGNEAVISCCGSICCSSIEMLMSAHCSPPSPLLRVTWGKRNCLSCEGCDGYSWDLWFPTLAMYSSKFNLQQSASFSCCYVGITDVPCLTMSMHLSAEAILVEQWTRMREMN